VAQKQNRCSPYHIKHSCNTACKSKNVNDAGTTLFATQYPQKDWRQRIGGGTHADAIMERIVRNTT
jgi:hypothetical protein